MRPKRIKTKYQKNLRKCLSFAELCEGIDDSEKELAAAWELGRECAGRLRNMRNRNKRGRKYRAVRVMSCGNKFFNDYALTFTASQRWPKTPYGKLKELEKVDAFPHAPIFQRKRLEAFRSASLSAAAEMITPKGRFTPPWNATLLGQVFETTRRLEPTDYRLIKIDASFPFEQIRSEVLALLRKHCPHRKTKGGNRYSTWLRNLALYRAHRAGWRFEDMDECWQASLRAEKESDKSDLTEKKRFGPPKQKIAQRIDLIKDLLQQVF